MKRFEIYVTKLSYGSETYIINLDNGIVDNLIFCAPILFRKNNNEKNHFHIQANTKSGRICTIFAEKMMYLDIKNIKKIVDEVTEEDCQYVKEKIAELYMSFDMERV